MKFIDVVHLQLHEHKLAPTEEAVAALRLAIELDPDYALPQASLGDIAMLEQDVGAAMDHYSKAFELLPTVGCCACCLKFDLELGSVYIMTLLVFRVHGPSKFHLWWQGLDTSSVAKECLRMLDFASLQHTSSNHRNWPRTTWMKLIE